MTNRTKETQPTTSWTKEDYTNFFELETQGGEYITTEGLIVIETTQINTPWSKETENSTTWSLIYDRYTL